MATIGRPTKFSKKLGDSICEELSEGISLRTVCLSDEMPSARTVFRWLRTDTEFRQQYARAKEESADAMAEEILDIADDSSDDEQEVEDEDGEISYTKTNHENIQRSRLRVDTRKWIMSKMKPKKYADKIDVTSGGEKINNNDLLNLTDAELHNIAKGRMEGTGSKGTSEEKPA